MPNSEILSNLKFLLDSGITEFLEDSPQKLYNKTHNDIKIDNSNKSEESFINMNNINSLDELKNSILKFNKCELKETAKNTVFADGNVNSRIMLIGEAPGSDEDDQGKPFVGRAGQLLNKMLAAINLDRNKVYITNIIPWRPPRNRQPSTEEILQCLPFVQRHIELIKPEVLILLGGTATKALLMSDKGIMRLQGKWYEYDSFGLASPIATRVMFHPAFLLRSPGYKKQAWEDLLAIKDKLGI